MSADKKSKKIEDILVKGEEVVVEIDIHWAIYWQSATVLVLGIILGLYVMELGALLAGVGILMFIYNTIKKEILMLVLTNKRVLMRYGILQVDVVDMRFDKIESVELERMPPGYILGYSNVVLMGTGQRFVSIPYAANGSEFRQAYNRLTLSDDDL